MNTSRRSAAGAARQDFKIDPSDHKTINFVCREKDSPQDRSIVRARHVGGLRTLFTHRHGDHLPNSPDGRKHLFALLQNLAGLQFSNAGTLAREIDRWAPWMSEPELLDTIQRVQRRPTTHRGDTLGKLVGLVDAERKACKCWSLWPIDLSLAEAKLREQKHDQEYQAEKRKAAGATPRAESNARTEPWKAAGMGKTKWYAQQKHDREAMRERAKEAAQEAGRDVANCFVGSITLSKRESSFIDTSRADELVRGPRPRKKCR